MDETGFSAGENYVYGSLVVVIIVNCINEVFKDDLLYHSYFHVLVICFCLLSACLVFILSRVCIRQPETGKKPVWKLKDPDHVSSKKKEDRENEFNTKRSRLLTSRRIYDLVYNVSILFVVAANILLSLSFCYSPSLKWDFQVAAITMGISGLYLYILVHQAAASYSWKPLKYGYQPFDEFIRVPMRVFIPQMALHLARSLSNFAGILFYQFSAVYFLVTTNRMSEEQIKRFQDKTNLADIHSFLVIVAIIFNAIGIIMIISNLAIARKLTMEDLLFTFEKSWKWNMVAIEYLLPDIEVNTLEELCDAFLEKIQKQDLTAQEQKALRYIQRPLWKTRHPFIGNRELHGLQEAPRTPKSDEQPSTSRSTQGPQPEEPQPSSSTQRPLIVG